MSIPTKTNQVLRRYGYEACLHAYELNSRHTGGDYTAAQLAEVQAKQEKGTTKVDTQERFRSAAAAGLELKAERARVAAEQKRRDERRVELERNRQDARAKKIAARSDAIRARADLAAEMYARRRAGDDVAAECYVKVHSDYAANLAAIGELVLGLQADPRYALERNVQMLGAVDAVLADVLDYIRDHATIDGLEELVDALQGSVNDHARSATTGGHFGADKWVTEVRAKVVQELGFSVKWARQQAAKAAAPAVEAVDGGAK